MSPSLAGRFNAKLAENTPANSSTLFLEDMMIVPSSDVSGGKKTCSGTLCIFVIRDSNSRM